jgi:excisionase family DNA binding protein
MPAASQQSETSEEPQVNGNADGARILKLFTAFLESSGSQKLLGRSEKSRKPEVPIQHRVWLTIREAAAYAGRPEQHLRKLIAAGALPVNREGHMRVRRADLEKL